jgi:hypothetical protein
VKSDFKFKQGLPASLLVGKPSEAEKYSATQQNPKHFSQLILKLSFIIVFSI